MNCKQGDLAVIVRSRAGNEGRFVTCLRLASKDELARAGYWLHIDKPCWILDAAINVTGGGQESIGLDEWMRPIRDNDGEDETLQWAPVPTKETA
jgi:hypothetical protein